MRATFSRLMTLAMICAMMVGFTPAYAAPAQATAGELRASLDHLLGEHVLLASSATGAALGGRTDEFTAAAAALDANSVDISKAIGSVYGAEAEGAFLPLWRSHIGFVVDYTQGVAAKDQAKMDKAVQDLTTYSSDFAAFLSGANPNLTKDAVAGLVGDHVMTLKGVIDAQAAGDFPTAYTNLRTAYSHMDMIAAGLSGAIGQQFPDKFTGAADSPAAALRSGLNMLMVEHSGLASMATGAALGGRTDEFNAAAAALDANSVDISKAIGSVYGAEAEGAFLPLWRSHIGFVVDYTQGAAAKDQAKMDKAVQDLTQYTNDFAAFLSGANPNLPKDAVASLLSTHVMTLKNVIDPQAAGNFTAAYTGVREANSHMTMIANPLTDAIVKQFPDKFGGGSGAPSGGTPAPAPGHGGDHGSMPGNLPATGEETDTQPWGLFLTLSAALLIGGSLILRASRRRA